MRTGSFRSLLRDLPPDFVRLFAANGISLIGDSFSLVALPFLILRHGLPAQDVGLALAVQAIMMLACVLPAGAMADMTQKRRLLLLAQTIAGSAQAAIALLAWTRQLSTGLLVVCSAAYGLSRALYRPASTAIMPQILPASLLQKANSLIGMQIAVTGLLGPALAGVIVALAGPIWGLLADALTFVVSIAWIYRITIRTSSDRGVRKIWGGRKTGPSAFQVMKSNRWLLAALFFFFIFTFLVMPAIFVLGPIIAAKRLGGAAAWSILLVCSSAGSLGGSALAMRFKHERPLLWAFASSAGVTPALLMLGQSFPLPALVPGFVLFGASIAYADAIWEACLQGGVPENVLGRVSSFDWAASNALRPVGFALVVPVAMAIGTGVLLGASAILIVLLAAAICMLPDVRAWMWPQRDVCMTANDAPVSPEGTDKYVSLPVHDCSSHCWMGDLGTILAGLEECGRLAKL